MKSRFAVGIVLITLIALASGLPALAEKGDKQIRFGVVFSNPTSDLVSDGQTTELDNSTGFHAGFEFGITDLIGIEPAISSAGHDVVVMEPGFPEFTVGDIDLVTVTANVNFHPWRDKKADFFIGPTIGYALWGDLETAEFPENFPADDEFLFGFNAGVTVPLGEAGWGFTGALNYLFSDLTLEGSSTDIGVDPIQVKIGLSYAF